MRIAQITPGNIPIPTDGWGAVEKVIWEYTKVLRDLGHDVEILYTDEVVKGEWDVVHVHMANLALILKKEEYHTSSLTTITMHTISERIRTFISKIWRQ